MYKTEINSPLGTLTLTSDGENLTGLFIENQKYFLNGMTDLIQNDNLEIFNKTKNWLEKYFKEENPSINELKLSPSGTEFQKIVWSCLLNIPYAKTITYKELRELSYMGASVLHENSIFPIRNEGIPIQIKNTNRPEDEGTLIVETTCHKPDHVITGIAGRQGFATISIEKDMMNSEIGFGRRVLQVLEDNQLSFEHTPSGIDTMNIIVEANSFIDHEQQILAGIHRAVQPDSIELESDLALIAIVGRGMKDGRGTAAKVFTALAKENINIKMIDQGSSELNIIVGVKNVHFKNAIRAIYHTFIDEEKKSGFN